MSEHDIITTLKETAIATKELMLTNGKLALQGQSTPTEWGGIVQQVATMQTPEEASAVVEDVTLLESLLKHAHQYGEKATEYCILEARTYVRIASLYQGWSYEDREKFQQVVSLKVRRIVFWIAEKSDDDLAIVFSRVANGSRIENVRREEMQITRYMAKQDKYKAAATRIVESFKQHGEVAVNLESFCDSFGGRGEIDAKTACVWIEQARKEVRKLGGVGLGGGDGKYVAIIADNDEQRLDMAKAILNRLRSVENDLKRMDEICQMIGIKPPVKEINSIIRIAKSMAASVSQNELIS